MPTLKTVKETSALLNKQKYEATRLRRWSLFCLVLVTFGLLDYCTSVIGITFLGAAEKNPLLTSAAEMNIMVFSCVKLAAVILIGIFFYKAGKIRNSAGNKFGIESPILLLTYSLSLFTLVTAVTNNIAVVFNLI
jgi:cation transport ATPase